MQDYIEPRWTKIEAGSYRYTNHLGRVLAYVTREGGAWVILLQLGGRFSQTRQLNYRPATLVEAKQYAQDAYTDMMGV